MTAEQLLSLADQFRRERRRFLAELGLTLKDPFSDTALTILLRLHFHKQPETQGQLAAALGVNCGAITYHADVLEQQGFARRQRREHDRRQVVLEIPDEVRPKVAHLVAELQKFHSGWDRKLAGLQMPNTA